MGNKSPSGSTTAGPTIDRRGSRFPRHGSGNTVKGKGETNTSTPTPAKGPKNYVDVGPVDETTGKEWWVGFCRRMYDFQEMKG